jgi:hypothetical protein
MVKGTRWFFRSPVLANEMAAEPLSHPQPASTARLHRDNGCFDVRLCAGGELPQIKSLIRVPQLSSQLGNKQMSLTQNRDLKSGTSLWLAEGKLLLPSAPLRPNTKIDVIVVGTGISGALVADALISAGLSVLAIDRRDPMAGSTPASTALLQGELDLPLLQLQEMRGKQAAARIWLRSAQAVQALADRIADLSIRCDFRARTSLYLPGNVLNIEELRKETDARVQCGLRSEFISAATLHDRTGLANRGAILSRGNAEAHRRTLAPLY